MKTPKLTHFCFLLSALCFSTSAFGAAMKWSDYPNRPYVTNGAWLMLYAETGATNYNQTWNQFTNQLWQRILGGTNYGLFTVVGAIAATNIVLAPASSQTNYTLSATNSLEQEILTANTNINLTVAADHAHVPSTLWINALTSTVNALLTIPAGCRTNLDFVSTITNGTARGYSIEYRTALFATNLWIRSSPSAIR